MGPKGKGKKGKKAGIEGENSARTVGSNLSIDEKEEAKIESPPKVDEKKEEPVAIVE